ncbi:Uncharacterized protein TCM_022059 [Theobroma cacao]|uniref:NAC domain-containing protein n=1 Tax=Theobroma cacao TaxID=3641 RepID=A0A061EST8_THECC|nr:Uncharacterized protein TCM_022059 [Theobroma cacao]
MNCWIIILINQLSDLGLDHWKQTKSFSQSKTITKTCSQSRMAFDQVMSTTMKFPMGYRFVPTEEELVLGYLLKKVKGETLPSQAVIDCEIYGDDKEPWKIFNQTSTDKFYVFTKLKKKNGRGRRIDRTAGCGTWKAQNTYLVMDSKNNHVGFNKLFVFEVKGSDSNNAINGHWLMHEFSLLNDKFFRYSRFCILSFLETYSILVILIPCYPALVKGSKKLRIVCMLDYASLFLLQSDFVLCEIRNKNATGVIQTEKEDCEKGSIVEELESCEDGILTVEELEDMMIGAEESFQSEKEDCSKGSTVIKLASCEVWMDTRGT